jgi:hypothetical protein
VIVTPQIKAVQAPEIVAPVVETNVDDDGDDEVRRVLYNQRNAFPWP